MKKIFLFGLIILSLFSVVFGVGFHSASEVLPGTFSSGNFVFDGNVGIGTGTPITSFHVKGTDLNHISVFENDVGNAAMDIIGNSNYNTAEVHFIDDSEIISSNNPMWRIGHQGSLGDFAIYVWNGSVNNYYVDILNNGDVGIGTTSPSAKIDVNGHGIIRGDLSLINPSGNTYIYYNNSLSLAHMGVGSRLNILSNGNVGILTEGPSYRLQVGETSNYGYVDATGAWQSSSDIRFKENIENINNALDKINQISGIKYNVINDSNVQIGFSAQEVEQVLPEIVSTDENGYKGVAYAKITPVLVNAIKELNQENQDLKQELCQKDNSYSWC